MTTSLFKLNLCLRRGILPSFITERNRPGELGIDYFEPAFEVGKLI